MVLLRVGLMCKTSLARRKGFQIRSLLVSLRISIIKFIVLNKEDRNVDHQKGDQLVVSVVRNMRVNVFLGLIVAMVLAKVAIW